MRKMVSCAAVLTVFLCAGCDEEKQKPTVSDNTVQPEVKKAKSRKAGGLSTADAPTALQDEAQAAADPGAGPENDPGRVSFDGDKPRKTGPGSTGAGAVFAGDQPASPKRKAAYTQPGSGNTLAVNEPPAPAGDKGSKKPIVLASAKTSSVLGDKSGAFVALDAGDPKSAPAPGAKGSCLPGMSYVDGYCIDQYEGSLETGGAAWPAHDKLDPAKSYKAVSKAGVKPQAYISGDQAAAACQASGKRLCSMKEWVQACQGPVKTQYPYGASYQAGACNEFDHKDHAGHSSAMHRLYGSKASYTLGPMNDPRLDQMPDTVAPSGSFSKCTNGYGVYDMVGNVHEWVSDKVGVKGFFKGGYFEDTQINGEGCKYTTSRHETAYHDYSTGFRCCSDPS